MPYKIGPAQYSRLLKALQYYQKFGYTYVDVPWAVNKEAIMITKPTWVSEETMPKYSVHYDVPYTRGEKLPPTVLYPVASAEQSFLQLQMDRLASGDDRDTNAYVTITPCFRNEPRLDDLHQPYFMKVELIDWLIGHEDQDLHEMIQLAVEHFSEYITVDVIENKEPNAGKWAFDIVSRRGRIELGSYGIRQADEVGTWIYGTGLAEPRLTYALELELTKNYQRFG
jgi:hypothetical protein